MESCDSMVNLEILSTLSRVARGRCNLFDIKAFDHKTKIKLPCQLPAEYYAIKLPLQLDIKGKLIISLNWGIVSHLVLAHTDKCTLSSIS